MLGSRGGLWWWGLGVFLGEIWGRERSVCVWNRLSGDEVLMLCNWCWW